MASGNKKTYILIGVIALVVGVGGFFAFKMLKKKATVPGSDTGDNGGNDSGGNNTATDDAGFWTEENKLAFGEITSELPEATKQAFLVFIEATKENIMAKMADYEPVERMRVLLKLYLDSQPSAKITAPANSEVIRNSSQGISGSASTAGLAGLKFPANIKIVSSADGLTDGCKNKKVINLAL
jgi:hypothetical protein